jgi:hypothetical protein
MYLVLFRDRISDSQRRVLQSFSTPSHCTVFATPPAEQEAVMLTFCLNWFPMPNFLDCSPNSRGLLPYGQLLAGAGENTEGNRKSRANGEDFLRGRKRSRMYVVIWSDGMALIQVGSDQGDTLEADYGPASRVPKKEAVPETTVLPSPYLPSTFPLACHHTDC